MTGQLFINDNGRLQLDTVELTSGDELEVLIVNGADNRTEWLKTTVENNGEDYYLTGLIGCSAVGLFAKI